MSSNCVAASADLIMLGTGENSRGIDLGNGLTVRMGQRVTTASPRNHGKHFNRDAEYDFLAYVPEDAAARLPMPGDVGASEGIREGGNDMQVWTWEELEDDSFLENDSFSVKVSHLQPTFCSSFIPRKSRSRLNDFQAQDTRFVWRILQNTTSCGLSVPCCHEFPSPPAAAAAAALPAAPPGGPPRILQLRVSVVVYAAFVCLLLMHAPVSSQCGGDALVNICACRDQCHTSA